MQVEHGRRLLGVFLRHIPEIQCMAIGQLDVELLGTGQRVGEPALIAISRIKNRLALSFVE